MFLLSYCVLGYDIFTEDECKTFTCNIMSNHQTCLRRLIKEDIDLYMHYFYPTLFLS